MEPIGLTMDELYAELGKRDLEIASLRKTLAVAVAQIPPKRAKRTPTRSAQDDANRGDGTETGGTPDASLDR